MNPTQLDLMNWCGRSWEDYRGDGEFAGLGEKPKVRVSLPSDTDKRWFSVGTWEDYIFFAMFGDEEADKYELLTLNMLKQDTPLDWMDNVFSFLVHEGWPGNVRRAINLWLEEFAYDY